MLGGKPHAIGPFVNIYNEATAKYFASRGATRICLPPELPLSAIRAIAQSQPDVTFEVFAFGRVPLAISARCYHARLNKLSKDNCKFVCEQDPDGLAVTTLDDEPFLAMNGVQTLSYTCASLLGDVDKLKRRRRRRDAAVAAAMRHGGGGASCSATRSTARSQRSEGAAKLSAIYPLKQSNGFLFSKPGAAFVTDSRRRAPDRAGGVTTFSRVLTNPLPSWERVASRSEAG